MICYVVAKDLKSMTPGRLAAQVHHAGTQMATRSEIGQKYLGEEGINTTIVLKASPEEYEFYLKLLEENLEGYTSDYNIVTDSSYPIKINGNTEYIVMDTCFWVVGPEEEVKPMLKGLKLW